MLHTIIEEPPIPPVCEFPLIWEKHPEPEDEALQPGKEVTVSIFDSEDAFKENQDHPYMPNPLNSGTQDAEAPMHTVDTLPLETQNGEAPTIGMFGQVSTHDEKNSNDDSPIFIDEEHMGQSSAKPKIKPKVNPVNIAKEKVKNPEPVTGLFRNIDLYDDELKRMSEENPSICVRTSDLRDDSSYGSNGSFSRMDEYDEELIRMRKEEQKKKKKGLFDI